MNSPRKNGSIWMLNDGRLGHWRQCQALLNGLCGVSDEIAAMPAHTLNLQPAAIQRWLAPRITPWADRGLNQPEADNEPIIIIGAGRQSAGVSRFLKRRYPDVFNVHILDPRMARDDFSVLIVPEHDGYQEDNVIVMRGSLVDIPEYKAAHDESFWPEGNGHKLAVLLAGNERQNFELWLAAEKLAESGKVRPILSLAPRTTPKWRVTTEKEWAGLSYRILGIEDGTDAYAHLLKTAEHFWVAGDSINQLSEVLAISETRPVWVEASRENARKQQWINDLLSRDEVRLLSDYPDAPAAEAVAASYDFWSRQPLRVAQATFEMIQAKLTAAAR